MSKISDEFNWTKRKAMLINLRKKKKKNKEKKQKEVVQIFTCRFCKSKNTTFYDKQLRSSDEGTNIIVICKDCSYKTII